MHMSRIFIAALCCFSLLARSADCFSSPVSLLFEPARSSDLPQARNNLRSSRSHTLVMQDLNTRRTTLKNSLNIAALFVAASFPTQCKAEETASAGDAVYENAKFSYKLAHPVDWKESRKPVKTHMDEIQFKGPNRGTEVGLTVDPVKINSLSEFGTPQEVGKKVMGAERARDGVVSAKLLGTRKAEYDGILYYTIEYESASSRGDKHFVATVAINNMKLYVVTAQTKQDTFATDGEAIKRSAASFRVTASAAF